MVLEYVWVPIVTGLVLLWSKFAGLDVRTRLLEQAEAHYQQQRVDEKTLRDEQRKEILTTIGNNHEMVMDKLEKVDLRVKTGH